MEAYAVDMFSGAGGLTYGLEQAGIDVVRGLDIDQHSAYPYNTNTDSTFRLTDVEPLAQNPEPIHRMYPWDADLTILAACAPCQPYSTMNHAEQDGASDHGKWGLLTKFKRIVEDVEPDVVVTENVLQVRNDDTYQAFEESIEEMGYFLNDPKNRKVYAPEYGIPQKRKRWVLLASREGPIRLPDPPYTDESEYPTVKEAIDHLPPVEAGETHPENDLHRARSLSDLNLERIRNMVPGGDWTRWEEKGLDHLLADCHTRDSGRSYKAPYSRMRPDEPAPTITTQFYNYGSGRFGHYDTDQDRALSLLEGALLQTFPPDYEFYDDFDDVGVKNVGRLIGNAVPPRLAEYIGKAIFDHVDAESSPVGATVKND
ncbi:DNA cytosine methyltransferase [Halorhabdus sp. CBA1104]|uniref:DNA cytosine methyltransferase n=1 Tax=Halorhabdus sp. CBA1104 TaxID=1380432 RepID=UPI0012B37D5E|nr:DNA (cytosine-5-)-methyltransferase [Halorhabdus sp. CBA1104]QGN05856.1 DNA cytosine methyltransferase [Halorhabdus sp. CBA1104]